MAAYEAVAASQAASNLWLPYLASGDNAAYTTGETWSTETWVMETTPTGDPTLNLFSGSTGCGNAVRTPIVGNELFKFTGTALCGAGSRHQFVPDADCATAWQSVSGH